MYLYLFFIFNYTNNIEGKYYKYKQLYNNYFHNKIVILSRSVMNQDININQLPIELLRKILSYLSQLDQMYYSQTVCKLWYNARYSNPAYKARFGGYILPTKILEKILHSLPQFDQVICTRVCKLWHDVITFQLIKRDSKYRLGKNLPFSHLLFGDNLWINGLIIDHIYENEHPEYLLYMKKSLFMSAMVSNKLERRCCIGFIILTGIYNGSIHFIRRALDFGGGINHALYLITRDYCCVDGCERYISNDHVHKVGKNGRDMFNWMINYGKKNGYTIDSKYLDQYNDI